ncbi:MAG: hypothetical protein PVH61_12720 [Candidatus Aminicenantes bacterium]
MSNMNVNANPKINTIKTASIKGNIIIGIIIPGIIGIINRIIGINFGLQLVPLRILSHYPRNNRINRMRSGNASSV